MSSVTAAAEFRPRYLRCRRRALPVVSNQTGHRRSTPTTDGPFRAELRGRAVGTGAALCCIALATALFAALTSHPALWTMLPGFGAALTLYTSSALLLRTSLGQLNRSNPPTRSRGSEV